MHVSMYEYVCRSNLGEAKWHSLNIKNAPKLNHARILM